MVILFTIIAKYSEMSILFTKLVNTFIYKAVNMFYMESKLGNLLVTEMKKRNLSSRDVAKSVNISHPLIGNIINGDQPSFETCIKLAPFLQLPDVEVMRIAGLIKPVPETTSEKEKLIYLFNKLNAKDKQTILDMMDFMLSK